MEGPVYRDALQAAGIEQCIPQPEQRQHLDQIIMDELVTPNSSRAHSRIR